MSDIESELRAHMLANGITPPDEFIWDDEIHRYSTNGKARDDAGFYCITKVPGDPVVGLGWYGDHRITGPDGIGWSSRGAKERDITKELQVMKGRSARQKQQMYKDGAKRAKARWDRAGEAGMETKNHPYLKKKKIALSDVLARRDMDRIPKTKDEETGEVTEWQEIDCLLIPAYNKHREIQTLQRIYPDGTKKFIWGTSPSGCYCVIGSKAQPGEMIWIAEGMATAVSVSLITKCMTVNAFSCHNLKAVAKIIEEKFPGNPIGIAGDPGSPGEEQAHAAALAVDGVVAIPPPECHGGDWNDVMNERKLVGARELLQQATEKADGKKAPAGEVDNPTITDPAELGEEPDSWRSRLIYTQGSRTTLPSPKPLEHNIRLFLMHHDDFEGMLGFDEFAHRAVLCHYPSWYEPSMATGELPRTVGDSDVTMIVAQLQSAGLEVVANRVGPVVETVARINSFNSLRDRLERLEWDGIERLDTWAIDTLGCEETPYVRAVTRKFLISAVARAMVPGVKVDHALIIEGKQGIGKSELVKELAFGPDFFTDEHIDFKSKEGAISVVGKWFCELAELTSLKRSDVDSAKAFITRTDDNYRPPYGKHTVKIPRACVFIGTTNAEHYLSDTTGNRRFWPVRAKKADREMIIEMRDQLWAEAVNVFRAGEKWWLDAEQATAAMEQQASRVNDDPWQAAIEGYINEHNLQVVCLHELLLEAIYKNSDPAHFKKWDSDRVRGLLQHMGWLSHRNTRASVAPAEYGHRPRLYWSPDIGPRLSVTDLAKYRVGPNFRKALQEGGVSGMRQVL